MRGSTIPSIALAALTGVAFSNAADAPDWVQSAMKRPLPPRAARAGAAYMHQEKLVDASKSTVRSRSRTVLKILGSERLGNAALLAPESLGEDFKLVGAWRVRPDGAAVPYDKRSIIIHDADDSYEFSMNRVHVFRPDELRVGDVLAWEYELKSRPEAFTEAWNFGWGMPTALSRFGVKLRDGWVLETLMSNHSEIPPSVDDEGYRVWEMRDLAEVEIETMGAPLRDLMPILHVSYGPPPGAGKQDARRFDSWERVASWYAGIVEGQVVSDAALKETAASLARGKDGPLGGIRGITRFVQGIRYLNVAIGRSTAEPHPAPQILANRFGDCEDKSVLTIALLKEIGVEAYPMLALTRDSGLVAEEFPAPDLFNHAIVAIRAPEEPDPDLHATVDVDGLGKLIVFDPTSSSTGLGDLPEVLQGTRAVLAHPDAGRLVTLPVLPPEASRRELRMEVAYADGGSIDVSAVIEHTGGAAAERRRHFESVRGDKRTEELLGALGSRGGRADLRRFEVRGVEAVGEPVFIDLDLRMPSPGRDLGSLRTLPVRLLLGTDAPRLLSGERTTPLLIQAGFEELERTVVAIPDGWILAPPPDPIRASSPVGDYDLSIERDEGRIVIHRRLTVRASTVSASDYGKVKEFFDRVLSADATDIAFEKAPGHD